MLIIDFSQLVVSSYMVLAFQSVDKTVDVDLVRHVTLDGIRYVNSKFKKEYGDPVIAVDDKNGSWRKTAFPYYKAHRKKDRKQSDIDWPELLRCVNTIKQELIEVFPYKVIEVDGAEADDIIGVLTRVAVSNRERVMIVSGDKDFIQLQIGTDLVNQWDKRTDTYVGSEDPKRYLFEHILKGDRGDGIPNILSAADSFVSNIRQKPMTNAKIEYFWENTEELKQNNRFKQNLQIIDLRFTPGNIKEKIIDQYKNYQCNDRRNLHDYFVQKRMKTLYEHLKEF